MPGEHIELKPVTRITTGAIGQPGKRVFFLQAEKSPDVVTIVVEKQQVASLALGMGEFIRELQQRFPDLDEATDRYSEREMQLRQPVDPLFRAGQMGLGYDQDSDMLVLVVQEIVPEGAEVEQASVVRLWATRSQMLALGRYGAQVVGQGRPICGSCGQPIDPEGHFCPRRNGHRH
ncbi:MAG: DUF3090 domain-containing protein [Chloroflexi bacterium]|nr:DUF3090 domain-containing protein [Chloroflexota bacterium]